MTVVQDRDDTRRSRPAPPPGAGAVYGLGMIGALVYYWRRADGLGGHVGAVGKSVVWPAFVVYGVLDHLGRR